MKKYFRVFAGMACTVGLALAVSGTVRLFGQDLERINPVPSANGTETRQAAPTVQSSTTTTAATADDAASGLSPNYVIGPEDILQIKVFDVKDLDETVRVANDGTITIPLLGPIKASGLTADQLRDRLEAALGKNLVQHPQVSVYIAGYHARPVSIVGAVQKPGLYQITGPRSLVEMLSVAGGLSTNNTEAAGKTVYVTRPSGFTNLKAVPGMHEISRDKVGINLKDLLYTQAPGLNIQIKPHDIIAVSKADVVYVAGSGVRKPGGFVMTNRDSITVLQALAMAQGLAPNAARHDARIIHTNPNGSHVEKFIDVEKIIKNKAPDPTLAANDILYIPNSRVKAVTKKTVESIVQTVSGFLIFHP